MRNPFRAAAAALARPEWILAAILLASPLRGAVAAEPLPWMMTLQQVGPGGAAVGTPVKLNCPSAGCETSLPLVLGTEAHDFHVQVDFVARGAYLSLEQRSPSIRAVMDFTTGYKGPIFAPLRRPNENALLVKLLIAGTEDTGNPVLANGPVFNGKMEPDAYLRVTFERAASGK
jgi:hypothetical protein